MSVFKKKGSPYYHYDFVIRGVRFHGSTHLTDREAAKRAEARLRVKIAEGTPQREEMTLNAAAERYYQEVGKHCASARTIDSQLAQLIQLYGASIYLSAIDDSAIAAAVARRRGQQAANRSKLVSPATVNRETELLRRLLTRASRVWKAATGDDRNWRQHLLPEPEERVRELSPLEEERLLSTLRPDLVPLVRFAIRSGVRLSEARGLTWAAVDLDRGEVTVRGKSRRPGGAVRALPLTRELIALLQARRGEHPIYVFTYLCRRSRGTRKKGERYPFSASGWRRVWKRALDRAGIEDFRFHDTRHTAASRVLRASGNLRAVQKLLGHASITTTARYAHVMLDDVRSAMEAVSRNSPEVVSPPAPETRGKSRR